MVRAAAELIADAARRDAAERGMFHAALSGGSTPKALFALLAEGEFRTLPWDKVRLFWGDERYVPPDHSESNYASAKELLLSRVPLPEAQVHRIPTEAGDPSADAAAYEALLKRALPLSEEGLPILDLALQGLGTDGHTASIFPGSPAARETERWVVASRSPSGIPERITLTVPILNRARRVVFLAAGEQKAEVVREILEGKSTPQSVPAKLIRPRGELIFLMDEAAASKLA